MDNPDPAAGPVAKPSAPAFDDSEPSFGERLAYVGSEVAKDAASEAVVGVAQTAFSAAYMFMLLIGAVVITVVDLVVVVVGGALTYLVVAKVAPGATGFVVPFWGIVFLVIAFFGVRWVVRRFARPVERGLAGTLDALSPMINRDGGDATGSAMAIRPVSPAPGHGPSTAPTLAELDARLAPKQPPPD
jgi:hypothetical protein